MSDIDDNVIYSLQRGRGKGRLKEKGEKERGEGERNLNNTFSSFSDGGFPDNIEVFGV